MKYSLILAALFAFPASGFSATLYVPDNYASIQDAVTAAVGGDTIIVRTGTYCENIDFLGKAVTVRSEWGPAATTIDGMKTGSVVVFQSGESAGSVLEGFSITNGEALQGGGICCSHSSPWIESNIISNNTAVSGGGISCWNADPDLINNIVAANISDTGAGINCEASSPLMTNNTITGNRTNGIAGGGGLRCIGCYSVITNTIIYGNFAPIDPEISLDGASSLTITYSDIGGGWPGTGNIDADPGFVEPAILDFHLTCDSACRDRGLWNAPSIPRKDFEGDLRDPCGIPDMGADEFRLHLYFTGDFVPGGTCDVRVTCTPTCPVRLGLGSGYRDPPLPTAYGDLYLLPPFIGFNLGTIPPNGVLIVPGRVPLGWAPGETYHFQALVEIFYPVTYEVLTNHEALTVK